MIKMIKEIEKDVVLVKYTIHLIIQTKINQIKSKVIMILNR